MVTLYTNRTSPYMQRLQEAAKAEVSQSLSTLRFNDAFGCLRLQESNPARLPVLSKNLHYAKLFEILRIYACFVPEVHVPQQSRPEQVPILQNSAYLGTSIQTPSRYWCKSRSITEGEEKRKSAARFGSHYFRTKFIR